MAAKEHDDSLEHLATDHPVATGVGAAGGAVTGATAGSVLGGPVGAVVGGVVGAVAGSLVARGAAETTDPDQDRYAVEEDAYWREQHSKEPYYNPERTYDDYAPAYRMGWESRSKLQGDFDQHEPALGSQWEAFRAQSRLSWAEAQHAARAGWRRFDDKPRNTNSGDPYARH